MALGLGVLRLEPKAFWSMTLRELEAALGSLLGGLDVVAPPMRRDMTALMQRYPDRS